MGNFDIKKIAYVENDFKEKFGIPRQSGRVDEIISKIIFLPEFRDKNALKGIEGFSHLWLIFDFSLSHTEKFSPTVRPPRLGGNKKMGVFATRSPFRPNPIGLSSVKLLKVFDDGKNGTVLLVAGADLLDGTPILDIKPYLPFTDSHPDAKGGFSTDFVDYKLKVTVNDGVLEVLPAELRSAVIKCIEEDPRPSYEDDEEKIYKMKFSSFDISFKVKGNSATIIKAEKI